MYRRRTTFLEASAKIRCLGERRRVVWSRRVCLIGSDVMMLSVYEAIRQSGDSFPGDNTVTNSARQRSQPF